MFSQDNSVAKLEQAYPISWGQTSDPIGWGTQCESIH